MEGLEASNRLESVRNRKNEFLRIDIDVQIIFWVHLGKNLEPLENLVMKSKDFSSDFLTRSFRFPYDLIRESEQKSLLFHHQIF